MGEFQEVWFGKSGGGDLGSFSSEHDSNGEADFGVGSWQPGHMRERLTPARWVRSDSRGREGHKSSPSCEDEGTQILLSQREWSKYEQRGTMPLHVSP